MRRSPPPQKASADTALASMRINADQAEIMEGQRGIAAEQNTILKEQARTARALANLEGPVLFVRRVGPAGFTALGGAALDGGRNIQPSTTVHFANYGRTPAVLLGAEGTIDFYKRPKPAPLYDDDMRRPMSLGIVEAGQEHNTPVVITGPLMTEEDTRAAIQKLGAFYVYGRLIYRGPFGERVETGFGYVLGRTESSVPLRPKAYNYHKTYDPEDQSAPHARYEG